MNQYVLARQDPANPLLSPLYADLHGLPPLLIHTAGRDVFLSDATRQAGISVTLKVWDAIVARFSNERRDSPEERASLREAYAFLRQIE